MAAKIEANRFFKKLADIEPYEPSSSLDATHDKYLKWQLEDAITRVGLYEHSSTIADILSKEWLAKANEFYIPTNSGLVVYHGFNLEGVLEAEIPVEVDSVSLYNELESKAPVSSVNSLDRTRTSYSNDSIESALAAQGIGMPEMEETIKALVNNLILAETGLGYAPTHKGLLYYHMAKIQ